MSDPQHTTPPAVDPDRTDERRPPESRARRTRSADPMGMALAERDPRTAPPEDRSRNAV